MPPAFPNESLPPTGLVTTSTASPTSSTPPQSGCDVAGLEAKFPVALAKAPLSEQMSLPQMMSLPVHPTQALRSLPPVMRYSACIVSTLCGYLLKAASPLANPHYCAVCTPSDTVYTLSLYYCGVTYWNGITPTRRSTGANSKNSSWTVSNGMATRSQAGYLKDPPRAPAFSSISCEQRVT